MSKLIRHFIGIAITFFLIGYLYKYWDELNYLMKLGPWDLVLIYAISLLGVINTAYIIHCLLRALHTKTGYWDMVLLQNVAYLLNYVPMKFGTLFRANYLKRRYKLSYAQFGAFFMYLTFLMIVIASLTSLTVLIFVYDVTSNETRVLLVVFFLTLFGSLFLAFVPMPLSFFTHKLGKNINNFLAARQQLVQNRQVLIGCSMLFFCNFLLTSCRLGIIYHAMGQELHSAGYLVLGALGYISLFLSLTPGSLGIRELVLSSGGMAMGIPFKVGILAAMIDRAIALSWVFVIGGASTAWLWRKYPTDFTTTKSL